MKTQKEIENLVSLLSLVIGVILIIIGLGGSTIAISTKSPIAIATIVKSPIVIATIVILIIGAILILVIGLIKLSRPSNWFKLKGAEK